MANLREKLLSLVEASTRQTKSIIDNVNETFNSIDWDAQVQTFNEMKENFLKKGNDLLEDFNELLKEVKNNISDFEVTVPFDQELGEEFDYHIENGKLTVEVSFVNENTEKFNKTSVTIPLSCDVEKVSTKYNAANKTMTVVIPKTLVEKDTEEKKVMEPKEAEEEEHEAASKLLKKFRENTANA